MQYDTLVSIGWNYPVIAGMLHDRNVADAVAMTEMIRATQDGRNRSPWNEPECNNHYSRMMSGWGLYDQACGLRYDSTQGLLAFDPRFSADNFRCFFAAEGGWGQFNQQGPVGLATGNASLTALHGTIKLSRFELASAATSGDVLLDSKKVAADVTNIDGTLVVQFKDPVMFCAGSVLAVTLRS